MKIIKPYGRSVVYGEHTARRLKLNKPAARMAEVEEVSKFSGTNPKALVAQWISAIDKIIKKPNQTDVHTAKNAVRDRINNPTDFDLLRKAQIEARTQLGNAAWLNLATMLPKEELPYFEKLWQSKLHPCGDDYSKFKNARFNPKGRWFFSYLGTKKRPGETQSARQLIAELAAIDHDLLANDIYTHLHQRERRKSGADRDYRSQDGKPHDRGLIASRANSVEQNTLPNRIGELISQRRMKELVSEVAKPGWSELAEQKFHSVGDLAEEIYQKCMSREKASERIKVDEAADAVFKHYGRQFGTKKREDIRQTDPDLLNLYDAIRTYYRVFLKTTGKGRSGLGHNKSRTSPISTVLPKDNQQLFKRLRDRHDNSVTNDLIRLGRVLHYSASEEDRDGFKLGSDAPVWSMSIDEIAKSEYWTTKGQADIKRTEAFVRVWRNVLSQAARTAHAMADPQNNALDIDKHGELVLDPDGKKRKGDVLGEIVGRYQSSKQDIQAHALEHAKLLFGVKAPLVSGGEVEPEEYIFGTLRLLATIRNQGFHFKARRSFVEKLESAFRDGGQNTSDSLKKAICQLYLEDTAARRDRLFDVCEGAAINRFANALELESYIAWIEDADESDFVLPKFNLILERMENIAKNDKDLRTFLPEPANALRMKNEGNLAKFIGLKLLYERPFRMWLESLPYEDQLAHVRRAVERGTQAARKINARDRASELTEAKTAALPEPSSAGSFAEYMDTLTAFQATEMRVQKGYESDPEEARKQMKWIEEFRREVVGYAFLQFIQEKQKEHSLFWLVNLNDRSKPGTPRSASRAQVMSETSVDQWLATVYYILHLVPVDDVSRLLHQFRKWGVLEAKSEAENASADSKVDALKRVIVLYLEMHDDKHSGEGINLGLEKFTEFFEDHTGFNRVFVTEGSTEQHLVSTRRGLREVQRYGHFDILRKAIGKSRITNREIAELEKYEHLKPGSAGDKTPIAQAQAKRVKLHKSISTSRQIEDADIAEYAKLLSWTIRHRTLANHVRLTNHARLHQILMRVMARLVDYAGLWERDGYFIALALMKLHDQKPADVILDSKARKDFQGSGRLPMDSECELDKSFLSRLSRFYPLDEKTRKTRNDLAHFNILAGDDIDLTEAINRTRFMMRYDRKLKNAVSKSIIEMLHREGMILSWKTTGHDLVDATLTSRKITHLQKLRKDVRGQHELEEEFHSSEFIQMAAHLFSQNS